MGKSRRITARVLVFDSQDRLLLGRENAKGPWYSLGGGLRENETLPQGIDRETYEEIGVGAVPSKLLIVSETLSKTTGEIQISFWFECTLKGDQPVKWKDVDEWVTETRYFSEKEIKQVRLVSPRWLDDTWEWRRGSSPIYKYEEFNVFPWRG